MKPTFETIQTDIKKVQAGDWFLPLTIKDINQHCLINDALEKGAVGFTFEQGQELSITTSAPHFSVPDLRQYLFSLAQQKRAQLNSQIAVITGSAGKTSVKEILGSILRSHSEKCFISPDNQNTKIALANQILRLPPDCPKAAFEMGARRLQDFQIPLSYLQPSIVALLNIGTAHVGEFGSLENLWKEKLSGLSAPSAKTIIAFGDDSKILDYAHTTQKKVITFGFNDDNDIQVLSDTKDTVDLKIFGFHKVFSTSFVSSGKGINVAAAVSLALALDIPFETIVHGLSKFTGVARRFQIFKWQGLTAIDDAFNASPESMNLGLEQLQKTFTNKKTLLVLGSMLELGTESEKAHDAVADSIHRLFLSQNTSLGLATVGDEALRIHSKALKLGLSKNQAKHFASAMEARAVIRQWSKEFEVIYFKGSKSIQLQNIFGEL